MVSFQKGSHSEFNRTIIKFSWWMWYFFEWRQSSDSMICRLKLPIFFWVLRSVILAFLALFLALCNSNQDNQGLLFNVKVFDIITFRSEFFFFKCTAIYQITSISLHFISWFTLLTGIFNFGVIVLGLYRSITPRTLPWIWSAYEIISRPYLPIHIGIIRGYRANPLQAFFILATCPATANSRFNLFF